MAKKPHELALNDYILGMSYKDIAEKYNVGVDTVKKWKTRYKWNRDSIPKGKKAVSTLSTKNEKVDKKGQEAQLLQELTSQEQLFCYHYTNHFNAMQAAMQSGYTQNKAAAKVQGCVMLKRPHVKAEVERLKGLLTQDLYVGAQDVLQQYIKIAFADVGDYLEFDGYSVKFKNSQELDTSVLSEVKEGKEGIAIKLTDKMKALEKLELYFDLLPDQWQRKVETEKLELERRKVEAAEKKAGDNDDDKPINITIRRKVKSDG